MSDTNDMNKQVIEEFRANDGKVGGFFANAELVLLHTIGAKSGKERIIPLMTIPDGERLVVAASKAGAPTHPDWFYNVKANPDIEVEYGTERFKVTATIADEPERSELYNKLATKHSNFAEYAEKAGRVIPVITLTRS